MKGLKGKVAIVTGASRGIGKGIARRLMEEDATVALVARDENRLQEALQELLAVTGREVSAAISLPADVTDPSQVARLIDACEERLGTPQLLVNNVGRADRKVTLDDVDEETLLFSYRANVLTSVLMTREFARKVRKANLPGAIVNIGSSAGFLPKPGRLQYTGAKAGLMGITKSLSGELAPLGIRVNMVCPGPTLTENKLSGANSPDLDPRLRRIPMGRMGKVEEIASVVAFLLSEDAAYVTGAIVPVDGGYTLGQ